MDGKITLTLNSPITEEQWDDITDVDFEHIGRVWFTTKHGNRFEFVKASAQPGVKAISYQDCQNALLKMWMDNVVTDGEYRRIVDKLNAIQEEQDADGA